MSETDTRPTPEQLANGYKSAADAVAVDNYRRRLSEHGYAIVHPDDVPRSEGTAKWDYPTPDHRAGWNACRAHIFGGFDV